MTEPGKTDSIKMRLPWLEGVVNSQGKRILIEWHYTPVIPAQAGIQAPVCHCKRQPVEASWDGGMKTPHVYIMDG